jgi:predicted nucleotidyltransferase
MDKKTALRKARAFSALAQQIVPHERTYLFGSYATGTPRDESDLDIGIVVPRIDGDFFKMLTQLYILRRQVDLRIEPHLIVENADPLDFAREVARTGIRL